MSSLMARLPDELLARCASVLDLPSAGRLAQASRAGQRLVLARLVEDKAERDAALAAAAAPLHGVALTAAGKAFIDTYADVFIAASRAGRMEIVKYIMSAATGVEHLGSTNWTAVMVRNRLLDVMKRRRRSA